MGSILGINYGLPMREAWSSGAPRRDESKQDMKENKYPDLKEMMNCYLDKSILSFFAKLTQLFVYFHNKTIGAGEADVSYMVS